MATGVPPREEPTITRTDLENLQDAMKCKKFRDLLADYCEEVRDPANQALFQKEMTQLEKERGYDVTFINPKGGYVIKTSVAGEKKAFINICSNEHIDKPSCSVQEVDGRRGMNWQLPYSLLSPREDYNVKREKIILYDVVFHPDTLRMAQANKQFRDLVNQTAFDGLAKTYNIHLDSNNYRFPRSQYKGMAIPAVIRHEDPNYKPPSEEETESLTPEIIEKLYPQRSYAEKPATDLKETETPSSSKPQAQPSKPKDSTTKTHLSKLQKRKDKNEFMHTTQSGYTIPKYVVKQQKAVDLQDYTNDKDCKQYTAIPSHIAVEINLPLLSSTKDCTLDVNEKSLSLKSEKPAKYKLDITLPYAVDEECGNAKFDKKRHMLLVTLPVARKHTCRINTVKSSRVDSGVESEDNSGSQSDEEFNRGNLVEEISSTPAEPVSLQVYHSVSTSKIESFFDTSLGYMLPSYTYNILDDVIAFTFHVKNSDPDSVVVKKDGNKIYTKFTSIGSGYVPVHYAAIIAFDKSVNFENVSGEAWDNNVILQLELTGDIPQKFEIGLMEDSMTSENFDISEIKKTAKGSGNISCDAIKEEPLPVVEVTNLGTETNIVVSSNMDELDEDDDIDSPTFNNKQDDVAWTDLGNKESGAKSILRKPSMMRSFSESSAGDIASSMDYISSDCIPEESSLKKTVRFNDVIAKQFYRYNSSIEGQKKKNQRKKSKKRNQDRKSESEAEDEVSNLTKEIRPKLKSAIKQRRDSGLADTSDAEADSKNTPVDNQQFYKYISNGFDTNNQETENSVKSILNIVDHSMPIDNEATETEDKKNTAMEFETSTNVAMNEKNSSNDSSGNAQALDSVNSLLNIVNKNGNTNEKSEPTIWKSESSMPSDPEPQDEDKKETSTAVTCDNIQHNTIFYDPDKLNKGHYQEVNFKNDLIFDLDM